MTNCRHTLIQILQTVLHLLNLTHVFLQPERVREMAQIGVSGEGRGVEEIPRQLKK